VRAYPAERRPAKVAANIVLDSQYRAFVAPVRRKRVEEVSAELVNTSRWSEAELGLPADLEIAVVLEVAESRGVDPGLVTLLRRFAAGETSEDIARGSGWSSRTIRNRRAEALEAVRRVLDDGVSA
jgi:DNA-directed RNA polymerase specialized sigma24 family protein